MRFPPYAFKLLSSFLGIKSYKENMLGHRVNVLNCQVVPEADCTNGYSPTLIFHRNLIKS